MDRISENMYLVRALSDSTGCLEVKAKIHHRHDMQHDHSHGRAKIVLHVSENGVQLLRLSRRGNVEADFYDVELGDGPLGLDLETNISDKERYGVASGRRASGLDLSAVVNGVSGQAAAKGIQLGNYLQSINGQTTLKSTFKKTSTFVRCFLLMLLFLYNAYRE